MRIPAVISALALSLSCTSASEAVFQDNDRIALIGNTLIERARLYGHLETALQLAAGADTDGLIFRNLGWSGDSVFGDSRAYFGKPDEGRDRLNQNIADIKPTVVLFCYGTGEAMSVDQGWTNEASTEGATGAGLESSLQIFVEGYQSLVERTRNAAGPELRELIFIAPPPLENLGGLLPNQSENNRRLGVFRDAIRELADKNEGHFVDLFQALGGDEFDDTVASSPLTTNGVHYTSDGYRVLARELVNGLGYEEVAFEATAPDSLKKLRDSVIEKNRLFFNRWRPANETYLFLFRAHEQGQNAKEIPMFDPIIEKEEATIAQLRKQVLAGGSTE